VQPKHTLRSSLTAFLSAFALLATQTPITACTRALYVAKDGTILTGRSMDWGEDLHSNMWALPRGMQRDGMGGANTIQWQSKYGSLVVSAYDIGTCDGINEKGLVVNMLALAESDYGTPKEGGKVICMSTWAQYLLDLHSNVADAVADLRQEAFRVQTIVLPTGRPANMHLAISDATGDSAIFEYVNGQFVIHHGKQYTVLTNSPTYDQQLAIMEYWRLAGGLTTSLPGTSNAADRYVRATFLLGALPVEPSQKYITGTPQEKFYFQAGMSVLSLMRSIGTPLGISLDDMPWVSSTVWRTVSDSTNRMVVFDSATTPATFWVKLDDLNFTPGAPVKKLTLTGGKTYNGNATDKFVEANLFPFASLDTKFEEPKH
jgi:penicillin V acylase-like amidase (Ntn superfamily)